MKYSYLNNHIEKQIIDYKNELNKSLSDISFLLAVSGGLDSIVLLDLFINLRRKYNYTLGCAYINYNTSKYSSQAHEYCKKYATDNNVEYYTKRCKVEKNNFESKARKIRYEYLNEIAISQSYDNILTAHHQDDQIETIFMKIEDNSDWISKIGIRQKYGIIRRPLLNLSKNILLNYAKTKKIIWLEDPMNKNLDLRRNLVRIKILPNLHKPSYKKLIDQANLSKTYTIKLDALINKYNNIIKYSLYKSGELYQLSKTLIQDLNIIDIKIFVYVLYNKITSNIICPKSKGFWIELRKFIKYSKTGSIFELEKLTLLINRDYLEIISNFRNIKKFKIKKIENNLIWNHGIFKYTKFIRGSLNKTDQSNIFLIDIAKYGENLFVRNWKYGDKIKVGNMHILLSDLFINNKISLFSKYLLPIITDKDDKILWVPEIKFKTSNIKTNKNISKNHRLINWIKS